MRLLVKILALALAGALLFIFGGQFLPEGSFLNEAADGFARALRIHWAISPLTGT
jgi:hypothetical protein